MQTPHAKKKAVGLQKRNLENESQDDEKNDLPSKLLKAEEVCNIMMGDFFLIVS
jgi:hypothetical protein